MRKIAQFGLLAFYFALAVALFFAIRLLRGDLPPYRWWDALAIGLIFSAIVMTIKELYSSEKVLKNFKERGYIIAWQIFFTVICAVFIGHSGYTKEILPDLFFNIPAVLGFLIYFFKNFKGFKNDWRDCLGEGVICSFLVVWSLFLWLTFWQSVFIGIYSSFSLLKDGVLLAVISLLISPLFSMITVAIVWLSIFLYKSFIFLNRFAFGEKEIKTTTSDL